MRKYATVGAVVTITTPFAGLDLCFRYCIVHLNLLKSKTQNFIKSSVNKLQYTINIVYNGNIFNFIYSSMHTI